jgi:uncharacterized protein (TIGR01319 family)
MDKTILITDIGSTTTKAVLIVFTDGKWELKGLANAPTTVEKPFEDVMAGVIDAVELLQKQAAYQLISVNSKTQAKQINPDIKWLSTSSAGGGLQILVIGLTKVESAASAQRAAYGVGGVLLDTIAIDDGRSAVEQMHAVEDKQPDIILMSGGYEGGAYASVLRQAEIISYCEIKPKYALKEKIPLIYAGNTDAAQAVVTILQDNYEVHILPNIRPNEAVERTENVTELVHELFLNKVMQQAPGYKALSCCVSDAIIPTPMGVMFALKLFAEVQNKNILAVDIGGATTDVYSNIFKHFYRTVSANYGMSYNLCNVFAKADRDQLKHWLHPSLSEADLRNYIGNKMLNPTLIPADDTSLHIEQALSRIALQLSFQQHLQMNFSISQIGHFIKMKNDELDPFHEQFYRDKLNEEAEFRMQDYDIIIGAGGVISHAPKPEQAAMMLIDGLQPRGATELWRDRHFISPHLGKLSQVDKDAALSLLKTECLEPLCLCIRPLPHKLRDAKPALTIDIETKSGRKTLIIDGNRLVFVKNNEPVKLHIKSIDSVHLAYEVKELELETGLPLLIDTRISASYTFETLNQNLNLYSDLAPAEFLSSQPTAVNDKHVITTGTQRHTFSLPYVGKIHVEAGEKVAPDTILGENLYDPPRIFVLQVFRGRESLCNETSFRKNLLVSTGEEVKNDQLIYKEQLSFLDSLMSASHFNYFSPVRGKVEKIDWKNGTLILREIQDYSFDPVVVKVCDKLGIKPAHLKGCMRKQKGDFITTDEILVVKSISKQEQIVHSPATGTITDVDTVKGTVTIRYIKKDLRLKACLNAKVTSVSRNRFIELEYEGTSIYGKIGFGKATDGTIVWNDKFVEADLKQDFIAIFPFALNNEQLNICKRNLIAGIIMPSMAEEDIVHLLGYELGVGITGGESLPFSIILTGGFGNFSFPANLANALRDCTGKHGVLFPATQIRAGVVRPSLIIQ